VVSRSQLAQLLQGDIRTTSRAGGNAKTFDRKCYNAGIHHRALSIPAFVAQALDE